jgi:2-oxo-4-hydroxy-4-carboxy-5-ureidoimidazoline decarboxylase
MGTSRLDVLNRAPDEQAAEDLRACNASPRWIEQVLARRPYADAPSLLDAGERVARGLPWDEVRRALDAHPRIGERVAGGSTDAEWSRREQFAVATTDPRTRDALRAGNEAYERRFGHVFLIRAATRSPEEMAAELDRRLANDDVHERVEVTEQLAQITRLRLEKLLTDPTH